ncbi:MAG: M28 family peptidase [Oscillospiraceae bacterium]|nr:M28 family peptidase [Oscillospiraceae bacterium]
MKCKGTVIMMTAVVLLVGLVGIVSGIRDSGDTDISFVPANFTASRQIPHIAADTPHGQASVAYIEILNDDFYNRFFFSYREMYTAAWLIEVLLAMGYTWDDIEVQEFSLADAESLTYMALTSHIAYFIDSSPFVNFGMRNSRLSQNVILTVPGRSEKTIIVGAHYDTVMFPGASDNASGTALLLESAQRMLETDNYYTIIYMFFGAEEGGLLGAHYYANSLSQTEHDNILFMINADILLEGPDLFYMGGYDTNGRPGTNRITETWDSIATDMYVEHGITFHAWPDGVFGPSDHLAFLPWGHTAMFLVGYDAIDGWYDMDYMVVSWDMMRVLHSPQDNMAYINEAWPGKIDANMRAFSLFLEALLLAAYH